jgi:hypothetical protein
MLRAALLAGAERGLNGVYCAWIRPPFRGWPS